ncbi:hypothetical protein Chor_001912 [Crotalus horridus]
MAAPLRLCRGVARLWQQPLLSRPPPRRAGSSGARSRLYEHAREGWASWPRLDVAGLSARMSEAERELEARKGPLKAPELRQLVSVWERLNQVQEEIAKLSEEKNRVRTEAYNFTQSHDESTLQMQFGDENEPRIVEIIGEKPEFDFKVKGHLEIGEKLDILRQRRLAHISGLRSYYLCGAGALLERALGFIPMTVPDLLKGAVFVSYFADHAVALKDLPVRIVCSSTCYRAETQTGKEPWGLYRVHQFNKVEIVLDMPPHELGLSAFRKFDIEAWMPGRNQYGEISSLSNCTDFQSRRLNIMYYDEKQQLSFAHTPLMGAEVITKPSHVLLKYIGPNQFKKGKKPIWKTQNE